MAKIIMFCHLQHDEKGNTSGPAIRAFNIAKSLAKQGNTVVLAEKNRKITEDIGNLKLVPWVETIHDNIKKYDFAYIQIWSSNNDFLKKVSQIPLIVDVYAPYMIEHIYHNFSPKSQSDRKNFKENILLPSLNPFLYGDLFLCANDRQRKYFLGLLTAIGRISPNSRGHDLVKIVPFGIREEFPKYEKEILKKKKELRGKKIILWLGPIFPWYDPLSMIEAMAIVAKKHPDHALVFVGGKSPLVESHLTNPTYKKSIELASGLRLLSKNVFFYDWMDYSSIKNLYFEAEFFVALHPVTLEMELSAEKGRVLDSLWANLPVICSKGDFLSEIVSSNKLGLTVNIGDIQDISEKINEMIENKKLRSNIKKNIMEYAKHRSWDNMVIPLIEFCKNPWKDNVKESFSIYNMLFEGQEDIERSQLEIASLKEKNYIKDSEIKILKEISSRHLGTIGRFKGSIVYPLYRFTSNFGRTRIGRIIERILK